MASELYFKDPLLTKWEQGASPITLSILKNARVHETCDAPLILTAIRDYTPESPTETAWVVTGDFVRLNGMLIAELSAAREMREVLSLCLLCIDEEIHDPRTLVDRRDSLTVLRRRVARLIGGDRG